MRAAEAEIAFSRTLTRPDTARPSTRLTEAVARYLFKLMAYKDEYEVARLHADTGFLDKVAAQFEGEGQDYKLAYHLAPPLIATQERQGRAAEAAVRAVDADGASRAREAEGPARHAARSFGRTEERRTERALIGEYRASIEEVLRALGPANLALAVEIARIPERSAATATSRRATSRRRGRSGTR